MKAEKIIRSPDVERKERVPPGQHLVTRFPVLHEGPAPAVREDWPIRLFGEVEEERVITLPELHALPQVQVLSDIHCVTSWSRLNNLWEGVATQELIKLVQLKPTARFVLVHAFRNYTTNLTLSDFLAEDVLLAFKLDGQPLEPAHGAPVRLVVPRLYFWKSAKWVTGVEFLSEEKLGYWEERGYHKRGDPWQEERYSS